MATEFSAPMQNFKKRTCQFCGDNFSQGGGIQLKECNHIFCRNCLRTSVLSILKTTTVVPCPSPGEFPCDGKLSNSELKELLSPRAYQEHMDKLLLNVLKAAKGVSKCNNPNCEGYFEIEGVKKYYRCSVCNAMNCMVCKTVHEKRRPCVELETQEALPGSSSATAIASTSSLNDMEVDVIQLSPVNGNIESDEDKCQYCFSPFMTIEEAIMLQTCSHVFCRKCLKYAIKNQNTAQIACLAPGRGRTKCNGYITDSEVKALVEPEVYEEYLNRSVSHMKSGMADAFSCKTPNCKGWCLFEPGRRTFQCPLCDKSNCLVCQYIHEGMPCDVYQKLSETGQHSKVEELMEKERKNGWKQLVQVMEISENAGLNRKSILEAMLHTDLLVNTMDFECLICFTEIQVGEGVILQDCLHLFCKDCLISVVENNEEPIVKCPYMDGNYSCVCLLQEREIKSLVPPAIYEKHLLRSMKLGESSMENSFHCKSPDCPGWCVFDGGVTCFACANCGKTNCIPCGAQHEGVSCDDFKNRIQQNANDKLSEEALENLIRTGNYMRCPKCKIPVQKTAGCDWIVCSACRTEICWATRGPRWGPRGRGDTTGGCRCELAKGRPCHPKCGNCH